LTLHANNRVNSPIACLNSFLFNFKTRFVIVAQRHHEKTFVDFAIGVYYSSWVACIGAEHRVPVKQ